MKTKICTICGDEKELHQFYRNKAYEIYGDRSGRQPYCIECDDEKRMQRYDEHKEEEHKRAAQHRKANLKYYAAKQNEYRDKDRERYNEYQREWRKRKKAKNETTS